MTNQSYGNGRIEGVVWLVPEPEAPSEHPYRYRLVHVCEGKRIAGLQLVEFVRAPGQSGSPT